MGVYVVRAFVKLRELLATNKELASRLDDPLGDPSAHERTDAQAPSLPRGFEDQ